MSIQSIAVTGGSGRIGGAIVAVLNRNGYGTVNLDRRKLSDEEAADRVTIADTADQYIEVDLLDAGETYAALAKSDVDAVIHMGTIPGPRSFPGHVTFESNAVSSYIVLEAATALGLESVAIASSISAMGAHFQDEQIEVSYLPVDEEHPATPRDPYAIGKRVVEEIAAGFGRRADRPRTISTIRFPGLSNDERFENWAVDGRTLDAMDEEGELWLRRGLFAHLHMEDAAEIARHAVEADFEGHETFWAAAPDLNVDVPCNVLIETFFPDAEIRASLGGRQSLIDTEKARELLDWEPTHSWQLD